MPSVAELVDAVAEELGVSFERRGELFLAAQKVRAEELRMVQTGFEPASIADLVLRSIPLLPTDLGGRRFSARGWGEEAPFADEPLPSFEDPSLPGDPFRREADNAWDDDAAGEAAMDAGEAAVDAGEAAVDGGDTADDDGREIKSDAEPIGRPVLTSYPSSISAAEEPAEAEDDVDDVEDAISFGAPAPPAPREGKLAAFLLLIAIGGGLYFFARSRRLPVAPPGDAPRAGGSAPAPAAPLPGSIGPGEVALPARPSVPLPATSSAIAPLAVSPRPLEPATAPAPAIAAPDLPESRGSSMISRDWTDRAPAYAIHFSSFQKRENADRDAARLGKVLGRPLRVMAVSLGSRGTWYRVILGEFATRDEAERSRQELTSKGIPGVGLVYRVSAR